MNNLELTECELLEIQQHNAERELFEIEQHNQDSQEAKISIRQAIKDLGLDKLSRDRLEYEAAENLLELNNLKDAIKLLSRSQKDSILRFIALRRSRAMGGKTKSENNKKSKDIRDIVGRWEALKANSAAKLPRGFKQDFIDAELEKHPSFELDRKNIENKLKY